MCGRFNVIDSPGLQQLLQDLGVDLSLSTYPLGNRANIAPTDKVPLIRQDSQTRDVADARWWLTPSWSKGVDQKYAMFNARSETLSASRAYSHPFKCQRGLVPMSSFIEWRNEEGTGAATKQPWRISNAQRALAVAALWDVWEGDDALNSGEEPLLSCTLLTTAAAAQFEPWHKRMPVVLVADEWDRWLDNSATIEAEDRIFRSELKTPWQLQPLAGEINNARNKSADLMRAVGEGVILPRD